jgi:catechol 2,3-dioxygenase-like lactoylglutathione lyase family enzyme
MRFKYQTRLIALLAVLWLAILQAAGALAAGSNRARLVQSVSAISTTVAEMDRSVLFYSQVLAFQKTSDQQVEANDAPLRVVRMQLGDESIELVQFKSKGRPVPPDSRSNDRWFQHIAITVSDMDRAYAVLRANHVEPVSVAPQRLPNRNKNAAGIRAFYFKDPDGHSLEILQFPAGKGDPKWQHSGGKLFLGIDHTAIVVADTEASLKFYRDQLGFRVASESENYGREQERLNNLSGARLRISSLRAQSGPGIELLEYLAPRTGRQLPNAPEGADLVHRQTILIANDPTIVATHFDHAAVQMLRGSADVVIHDPDGHELLVHTVGTNNTYGELK